MQEALCFCPPFVVAGIAVQGVVPITLLDAFFVADPFVFFGLLLFPGALAWRRVLRSHLERPVALAPPAAAMPISRETAIHAPRRDATNEDTDDCADRYDIHKVAGGQHGEFAVRGDGKRGV